jgi:hypothetical protein
MKMVKSLLLGSAAGVVAMSAAQAADLPVKAKAVEYVRICSLYGKGFFYLPGSNDMCLSITGFVRAQWTFWDGGNGAASQSGTASVFSGPNGNDIRSAGGTGLTNNNSWSPRVRTMLTFDSRAQTAYGTLRAVSTIGYTNDLNSGPAGASIYANRGFIQIAGFTLGKAVSFFDFYSAPASSYTATASGDTGDGGWIVAAYTAQFGGGFSATVSAEEPRRATIISANNTATVGVGVGGVTGPTYLNSYIQQRMPDVVGNLRWDQAWGSIQVMGALHDASSGYYNAAGAAAPSQNAGHPGDAWGWVLGVGARLRIGADVFDSQFTYTEGALRYLIHAQNAAGYYQYQTQEFGYGIFSDGVFNNATLGSVELTTGWAVNASYDHRWSPSLKTSIYGSYISISYNANANASLCASANTAANAGVGTANFATGVCDNDWQLWYIGSRTQWDVARAFYVGVDVLYQRLQTASAGATTVAGFTPGGVRPAGTYGISDQEAWSLVFRAHRDILP